MRAHPLLYLVATAGAVLAAAAARNAGAQTAAVAPTTYYLEAIVNGRDTELIVQIDRDARGFVMSADELTAIGVRVDNLPLDADRRVALADVPDLQTRYLEAEQRMELTLPDAQLVPERIGFANPKPPPPQTGTGLLFNYAANLQSSRVELTQRQNARRLHVPLLGSARYGHLPVVSQEEFDAHYAQRNRTFALSSELRLFSRRGVLVNTGYSTLENGHHDYTRQDSYWTYSDVERMRTYTVGDFISSSLTWTRAVRLGGISIARNFDVRPDLITFPVPALGGSAVVPTTVDLFINGLRQETAQATGGPFVFAGAPALTGAGQARIVFQDALGREVVLMRPLYMDSRLLAAGNTDYAAQFGYVRRSYGSRSFDYRDSPALTGSLRRGMRDGFTFEAHGEFADGLRNAGVGALVELGRFGVIDGSWSQSAGDARGNQYGLGYQYLSPYFTIDIRGLRTQDDYRDIGFLEGALIPERQAHASFSVPITQRHSVIVTYTRQDASATGGSRIITLGYNGSFGERLNVFATAYRDLDQDDPGGLYIGASLSLDNRRSASVAASRNGDVDTVTLSAGRSVDYERGGFGWNLSLDGGSDDYRHSLGRLDYRGRHVEASLTAEHARRGTQRYINHSLFANGAFILMDGDLMASRYVYDAFALVSTRGVPNVPVLRENAYVGTTNRHGHLLVPDLQAYEINRLALDVTNLPIDIAYQSDRMEVAPRAQSGVLADFAMGRYEGATVILHDEAGAPLPVGTPVEQLDTGESYVVGYDGEVFVPALVDQARLAATIGGVRCVATIRFDKETDVLKTIGPFTCARSP
ncbi:fimbria/pilus outer membrane usher protein [Lysobacter auxotrophicus]|uniref:Fimbria/pilus outer membrane usher protein n=1 Tax=Lysobacter auxotrophicus TaxID=2992573 RepID=A0ABM8DCB5_9GAMM|nr:fimbria/pilus outer membrane usher protein [Lysobacter auxotrophicus]BDU16232.1 fimbria/pilus outer membrane usher protein [Lysobacter auxotrophicus]